MTSMTVVTQGPSPEEDYGLDAVAQHNALASTERFPAYHEDAKGLGIYQDDFYQEDPTYIHNPPTPRSNTDDGVRTRSGRSTRGRTDSPFSTGKSRVSKSPAARSKKDKKSSKMDKSKTPKLTAPLSVLTKDMEVPTKDIDAWVHRSAEVRRQEVEKRNGYVTRPMNSFMLYRSAYAERTKAWCVQNNHQVVSSVSGESWPMEPEEVRNQFNEWAKIERANHAAAHPEYKFSPSKSTNKRRKGEYTDDEEEGSDVDGDPDGEYRTGGRNVRQRRHVNHNELAAAYLPSNVGFSSHPYYGQQAEYDYGYGGVDPGRPLPSNIAYDASGMAYNPQTGTYIQTSMHPQYAQQYGYVEDVRAVGVRIPTPNSMNGNQSIGGYGLPGGQISTDDLFAAASRTGTPASYNQYGQAVHQPVSYPPQPQYHSYTPQPVQAPYQPQAPAPQMYEHAQYLQQAAQPQAAIDPSLEAALAAGGQVQSHFDEAIGDFVGDEDLTNLPAEYFEESTSPNQTLAPAWSSAEAL